MDQGSFPSIALFIGVLGSESTKVVCTTQRGARLPSERGGEILMPNAAAGSLGELPGRGAASEPERAFFCFRGCVPRWSPRAD